MSWNGSIVYLKISKLFIRNKIDSKGSVKGNVKGVKDFINQSKTMKDAA